MQQAGHSNQKTKVLKATTVLEREFADKEQEIQRLIGSSEDREAKSLKSSERSMYNILLCSIKLLRVLFLLALKEFPEGTELVSAVTLLALNEQVKKDQLIEAHQDTDLVSIMYCQEYILLVLCITIFCYYLFIVLWSDTYYRAARKDSS